MQQCRNAKNCTEWTRCSHKLGQRLSYWQRSNCSSTRRSVTPGLLRITGTLDWIKPDKPYSLLLNQALIGERANAPRTRINQILRLHEKMGLISKRDKYPKFIDPEGL